MCEKRTVRNNFHDEITEPPSSLASRVFGLYCEAKEGINLKAIHRKKSRRESLIACLSVTP